MIRIPVPKKKEDAIEIPKNLLKITFKNVEDSGVYRLKVVVSDGVNEESYYSEEISVNIAKGTYQKVTHGTLSGKYDPNLTLADYLLDEGFSWVEKSDLFLYRRRPSER